MTTSNFSIEDLANSLIGRLDRRRIFPPYYNNPEGFVSPTTSITNSSCRRPRRPPNAFLLCRKNVHQEAKRRGSCNMRVISKVTGILWRNASLEEKEVYERLADVVNEIHVQRHNVLYRQYQQQDVLGDVLPLSQPATSCISTPLRPMAYKPYQIPSPPFYHGNLEKSWQVPSSTANYNSSYNKPAQVQVPSPPMTNHHPDNNPAQLNNNNNFGGLQSFDDNAITELPAFTQDQNQLLTYYFDLLAPQQQ
ncbi:23780_t:CDS:2 [Dentiscutata erythropus]|uniref:23780_t:CDS:1 n=1 Tax=Dentiscutata erythropus TaxID=1348616 RepID=A0A9N8VQY6_9GLOM|nr:23780_t:CDS:2 [Dentiscutata erythropus]